ncbi:MAG: cytochrome c family protein [Candidatus Omnitrophota bacterium]
MKKYYFIILILAGVALLSVPFAGAQEEESYTPPAPKKIYSKPSVSESGEQATYVGIESCKACHAKRYEDFQKRKFKKAWTILEMRGENKNPECLVCHTTGYGKPGGFVNEQITPHLKFKQCEACHGPASLHTKNISDKKYSKQLLNTIKDEDTCIQCHKCVATHSSTDF